MKAGPYTNITDRDIRAYLGHGIGNRRVRITRDGEVHYYGSMDDTDRSHDYWHYAGRRGDIARDIACGFDTGSATVTDDLMNTTT